MKDFRQILREATYDWDLDSIDRSWFITDLNEVISEMSHRIILKRKFSEEWNNMKVRGIEDGDIEEAFTQRLVKHLNWIKIGELGYFYAMIPELNRRAKDILYSFCNSILKVRPDIGGMIFEISSYKYVNIKKTVQEIADDCLYDLKMEEKKLPDVSDLIKLN